MPAETGRLTSLAVLRVIIGGRAVTIRWAGVGAGLGVVAVHRASPASYRWPAASRCDSADPPPGATDRPPAMAAARAASGPGGASCRAGSTPRRLGTRWCGRRNSRSKATATTAKKAMGMANVRSPPCGVLSGVTAASTLSPGIDLSCR